MAISREVCLNESDALSCFNLPYIIHMYTNSNSHLKNGLSAMNERRLPSMGIYCQLRRDQGATFPRVKYAILIRVAYHQRRANAQESHAQEATAIKL